MDEFAESVATWRTIGPAFAAARPDPWPLVLDWARENLAGGPILDLAGGHGRYAGPLVESGRRVVLADVSRPILTARAPPVIDAVEASATGLPFRSRSFAGALFIAGLHAIPHRENRVGSLRELERVLGPGAPALVSVWSRDHPRFAEANARGEDDVYVSWPTPHGPVPRFTHLYDEGSLARDLDAAGLIVERIFRAAASGRGPADNVFAVVRARHST